MFEQQIEQTIALFGSRTIGESRTISFREIMYSVMPNSLKKFYEKEVQRWIVEERERLVTSPHFIYGDSQVLSQFDAITARGADYAQFSRDEFMAILDHGVKLVFNYLCRPQYTLTNFAFRDASNVSRESLLDHVSQFMDYDYYRIILGEYFGKKNLAEISKERFENLLGLIDAEYIRNFDSFKLAHMTEPIFELFQPGEEAARIPIEALTVFYDDKNLTDIVEELEKNKDVFPLVSMHDLVMMIGNVDHTIGFDIRDIVTSHISGAAPPPVFSPVGENYEIPEIDEVIPEESVDGLPDESVTLPLEQPVEADMNPPDEFIVDYDDETEMSGEQITPEFVIEPESDSAGFPPGENIIPPDFFIDNEKTEDEAIPEPETLDIPPLLPEEPFKDVAEDEESFLKALDLTDTGIVGTGSPYAKDADIPDITLDHIEVKPDILETDHTVPDIPDSIVTSPEEFVRPEEKPAGDKREIVAQLGDLRTAINPADRKKFIKKLFGRNEAAYDKAIDELNESASWREASEHIDEIFLQHKIDMYSRVAVEFTDSIYKRYLQRK